MLKPLDSNHSWASVLPYDLLKIWAILLTISNKRSAAAVLAAVKTAMSKYATTKIAVVDHSLGKSLNDSFVLITDYLQEVLSLWFLQRIYL